MNVVGTTGVAFMGLQASSNLTTAKVNLLTTTAVASFAANGTLTIATPVTTNVPEPTTTGLALAGLLVAGAVARRRAAK